MNEEDVMETSVMHLCIPDHKEKEKDGLIVPSDCSYNAVSILLNEDPNWSCAYHFPVYDMNDQPSNAVIIRNLPSGFDLYSEDRDELKSMIENLCPIVSINQASTFTQYGVVRVTLNNREDAVKVSPELDAQLFHDEHGRVSHNDRGCTYHFPKPQTAPDGYGGTGGGNPFGGTRDSNPFGGCGGGNPFGGTADSDPFRWAYWQCI